MKKAVIITLLICFQFSGIIYALDEKPVIKEPIPPVNIDKTANVEEVDAVQAKPGKPEIPKKREMDTNYDGRVDRIEVYDSEGRVLRLDVDTDFDGIFEEWMIYENGKPKIKGVDRNKDGRTDTWIEY